MGFRVWGRGRVGVMVRASAPSSTTETVPPPAPFQLGGARPSIPKGTWSGSGLGLGLGRGPGLGLGLGLGLGTGLG